MALIYHYCSPQTFLHIIENKCIWLSSTNNMNDSSEGIWVKNAFQNAVYELKSLYGIQWVMQTLKNYDEINLPKYICCFSKDGDSLSQWRAYAQDGEGISIGIEDGDLGINEHSLSANMDPRKSLAIKEIDYVSEGDIYHEFITYANDNISPDDFYKGSAYTFAKYCVDRAAIVKNPAFTEEKEKRLIFSYAEWGGYVTDDLDTENNELDELKFRVSNGYLTNHFEYTIPTKSIKEIYIGPKNKFSTYDLNLFLNHNSLWDVEVKRSSATYR
ncbi:DUF2971 domain-containing protein [Serratia proteamaculans]|uniref:DUF2971 domain-containing protein n=1 Tax=Serratia proteamaculans TaxID=28151 RepID=UPI00217A7208|nr:DUF2971 domain-containing protein [Serratia proteamaculans]CAI1576743.1 Protein of uncharacterised function (DUF2971) [Serratia proteamaculans]